MNQKKKKKAVNYPDAFKYQDVQNIWITNELFFISFLPIDIFALVHDLGEEIEISWCWIILSWF